MAFQAEIVGPRAIRGSSGPHCRYECLEGWAEFAAALHRVDRQQELLEAALVAAPTLPTEEPPDRAGSFL